MSARQFGRVFECVAVDLNTQRDFCEESGAFPAVNLGELIPSLRRMIAWIKRYQIPVISSIESHREYELSDSGNPIHCVDGSDGQEKLGFTMLGNRIYLASDNTLCVPLDLFHRYQQVIFWKRTDDLTSNPKADRMLTQLPVREYVLFGVGVETSIKALALALLTRGKRVTVATDALGYWSRGTADLALRQIAAKGARLTTVDQLLARRPVRRIRYGSAPGTVRLFASPSDRVVHSPSNGRATNGALKPRLSHSPTNGKMPGSNGSSSRTGS